jgi:hypothetical protein
VSTPPGADAGAGAPGQGAEPTEQELRAAYEAELSRISSADVMLQATVSLLNIGGMRLGLASAPGETGGPERDLEQVREAIDGVRALLPILERKAPQELRPLRDALSQLQMAYARETGAGAPAEVAAPVNAGAPAATESATAPGQPTAPSSEPQAPPAADPAGESAVSSGRLWVPGR